MKCEKCGETIQKGAIVTKIDAVWCDEEESKKRGRHAKSLINNSISLGKLDLIHGQVVLELAYYCKKCGLVYGIFTIRK